MRGKTLLTGEHISYYIVCLCTFLIFFSKTGDRLNRLGLLLGITIILLNISKKSICRIIPSFLFAMLALFLLVISGKANVRGFDAPIGHVYKFVQFFLVVTLSTIIESYDLKKKKKVLGYAFFAFLITCIISLYYVFTKTPFAIRYAGNLTLIYGEDIEVTSYPYVATFAQCYAAPLIVVSFIVLWLRAGKRRRVVFSNYYLLFIVFVGFVFFSLLTSSILLVFLGTFLSYLLYVYYEKNYKMVAVLFFGMVILSFVAIFRVQISDYLFKITESLNWQLRERLRYVFDKILRTSHDNGFYTHDDRDRLVGYSLNSFKKYPLFGAGYSRFGYGVIGSHQEWGDLIGTFGIVGSLTFFCVFFNIYIYTYKNTKTRTDRICFVINSILFTLLGFLNPCLSSPILFSLFIISPNISSLYGDKRQKTIIDSVVSVKIGRATF